MKKLVLLLVFFTSLLVSQAQKTLLIEKVGTSSRYAYHLGDDIKVRTVKDKLILKSYLWHLTDTTLTIGPRTTIPVTDIDAFYRDHHFPKLMSRFFFIAGAGYLLIDSFNNLINNEQVFESQTLIISASLIGISLALIPAHQTKHKIGVRWKVKILDEDIRFD
jgi:hypothetical protein